MLPLGQVVVFFSRQHRHANSRLVRAMILSVNNLIQDKCGIEEKHFRNMKYMQHYLNSRSPLSIRHSYVIQIF